MNIITPGPKSRKRLIRKIIAIFFLITILNQIFLPSVAYALTSGPTAPEATSFEPVDTTDMVSPITGDFVYDLPLLEVPGPEGGYPLSLSYHGGIQPNEDASWVGLGWSLNPGAINRSVNGFPDDWYGANSSRRDYWEGGVTTTTSIGLSIPIGGFIASVDFNLSIRQDTYKGLGVGYGLGISGGPVGSHIGGSVGIGVTPDGDAYVYGSIGINTKKNGSGGGGLGFGIGGMYDFNSNKLSGGFNFSASYSSLGVSMSSSNLTPKFNISFSKSTENANAGGISTETSSVSVDLILVSYSREKQRYWSDETQNSNMYGALYPSIYYYLNIPDSEAYDSYSLPDPEKNIIDNPDPSKLQGGAFPAFDSYQVSAQGLGGTMRPYRFSGEVHQQNKIERINQNTTVKTVEYISNSLGDTYPSFRFDNDFSNYYLQNYPDFYSVDNWLIFGSPPYSGPQTDDYNWYGGISGNKLAGSRYITYSVTRSDGAIVPFDTQTPFITPVVAGLDRRAHTFQAVTANHIAGFSITNANGVTYHYNLPAHSYDEEIHQEKIDQSNGLLFNRQTRNEGYAYTWYLTAITGPDYVDRGIPGQLDDQDYGHWVSFEYGKWSDKYVWRNPSEGYHRDDDHQFKDVSIGRKEIYYLNAVRTRSHVAIFEKDTRFDGKGASPESFNKNWSNQNNASTNYQNEGVYNVNSSQSMRLDKIYLLNAADANMIASYSGGNGNYIPYGRTVSCSDCELPNNVIDKNDVNAVGRSLLESKAIRIINFNYDYHLAQGTTNSFDINNPGVRSGKLCLNSVDFKGKGGATILPPVTFSYDLDDIEKNRSSGYLNSNSFACTNGQYEVGDLLETDSGTPVYCGVITSKTVSGGNYVYTLLNSNFSGSSANQPVRKTKNPPYNKNLYDSWGMYKSDFTNSDNENLSRTTTPISNKAVDSWSLRNVNTSLGAGVKIDLEGDTYSRSVLNSKRSLILSNISYGSPNYLSFTVNTAGQDINELFKVGDKVDLLLLKQNYWAFSHLYTYSNIVSSGYTYSPTITNIYGNQVYLQVDPQMITDIGVNGGSASVSLPTGNLSFKGSHKYYGGGIRVKDIAVDNFSGTVSRVKYSYNILNSANQADISSGITSYEPITLDIDNVRPSIPATSSTDDAVKNYRRELYKDMNRLLAISREVPPPTVMYEYVTLQNEVQNAEDGVARTVEGKTTYQFSVFRENMVGMQDVSAQRSAPRSSGETYYTRNLVMKRFVSNVGSVKHIITYDNLGNKLRETINHYLDDGLEALPHADFMTAYEQRLNQYHHQGLLKERYSEVKSVWTGNAANFDIKATMTAREEYPSVNTGQTVIDYVTGITTNVENLAFDLYSGNVTKTVNTDTYGNRFMTEIVPAYTKYTAMGLKMQSIDFKNMLNQTAAQYIYKVDAANNKLGIVSSSIGLWSNALPVLDPSGNEITQNNLSDGVVWRKSSVYNLMPSGQNADGIIPMSTPDFNWSDPASSSPEWKQTSQVTLYDVYSKPLEDKNINGQYSTVRMGYNNSKVIVSASQSKYNEVAFASAEDAVLPTGKFSTNVSPGAGTLDPTVAHTGTKSLRIQPGNSGFIYQVPITKLTPGGRDYAISVWVRPTVADVSNARLYYQIDGQSIVYNSPTFQKAAAGWYLLEMRVPKSALSGASGNLTVGCQTIGGSEALNFDDLRFQPVNSSSTAYVYDRFSGELTFMLNNNNLYTKYEYDPAGRLIRTYIEVLGKATIPLVQETAYNYGNFLQRNDAVTQSFIPDNCGPNAHGSPVVYVVPYGQYTATTKAAANALAMNDVYANGQNYANSHGTCKPTIYARLEMDNVNYSNNYSWNVYTSQTTADIYIRLYTDANCTIPYTLTSDMDATFEQTYNSQDYYNSYSNVTDNTYTITAGNSSIYLGGWITSYYYEDLNQYDSMQSWSYSFSMLGNPNGAYIPVP